MKAGRPLRFLAVTLAGWSFARAALLWPGIDPGAAVSALLGIEPAAAALTAIAPREVVPKSRRATRPPDRPRRVAIVPREIVAIVAAPQPIATHAPAADYAPTPLLPPPIARAGSRWSASLWLIARGGARDALAGGQLGASQAGARIAYVLDRRRRVAIAARVSAPLRGAGREAAIGVDWQPTAAPIHLIAERRVALDGGRGGATLMLVGGIGPTAIAPGWRLEGYGQAGGIARDGVEGFVDGGVRITRRVAARGGWTLDMGAGAWGGAQRGAARLDVGPSIAVAAPIGDRVVRIALDWRQRIAGDAHPGSGPALSIGSDF